MASDQTVRLSAAERESIRVAADTVAQELGFRWDLISLFGSRTNPEARGGDIDLYVETVLDASTAVDSETAFVVELWNKIGEQKIDVVLHLITSDYKLAIYDVARTEGVQLV